MRVYFYIGAVNYVALRQDHCLHTSTKRGVYVGSNILDKAFR